MPRTSKFGEVPVDFDERIDEWECDNDDLDNLLSNMDREDSEAHHIAALFGGTDGFGDIKSGSMRRRRKMSLSLTRWFMIISLCVGIVFSVLEVKSYVEKGRSFSSVLQSKNPEEIINGAESADNDFAYNSNQNPDGNIVSPNLDDTKGDTDDTSDEGNLNINESYKTDDGKFIMTTSIDNEIIETESTDTIADHVDDGVMKELFDEADDVLDDDEMMIHGDDFSHLPQVNNDGLSPTGHDIKRIAILGERRTGTFWFANKMKQCFPELEVTTNLTRHSHWFQTDEIGSIPTRTIVLPLFLNIFHWVDTMRKFPQFMPDHMNMDWFEFVSTPWETPRSRHDAKFLKNRGGDPNRRICQFNFTYNEVVSCEDNRGRFGMDAPIYELRDDGSGKSFGSILELRKQKILNWMATAHYENVELVLPVQYEQLVSEGGFSTVADAIQSQTDLESNCTFTQIKSDEINVDLNERAPVFWEDLDPEFVKWMNISVNWDVEFIIGYEPEVPDVFSSEELHALPLDNMAEYLYQISSAYPSNSVDLRIQQTPSPSITPVSTLAADVFLSGNISSLSLDDIPGTPLLERGSIDLNLTTVLNNSTTVQNNADVESDSLNSLGDYLNFTSPENLDAFTRDASTLSLDDDVSIIQNISQQYDEGNNSFSSND